MIKVDGLTTAQLHSLSGAFLAAGYSFDTGFGTLDIVDHQRRQYARVQEWAGAFMLSTTASHWTKQQAVEFGAEIVSAVGLLYLIDHVAPGLTR